MSPVDGGRRRDSPDTNSVHRVGAGQAFVGNRPVGRIHRKQDARCTRIRIPHAEVGDDRAIHTSEWTFEVFAAVFIVEYHRSWS